MKKRTTKRKTRNGTSVLLLLVLAAAPMAPTAYARGRAKGPVAYAVVAGTVFRDPGFVVPSAKVTLRADSGPSKPMKAVTDARGEFAFRVPPLPMHYTLSVEAKGLGPMEKPAEIRGEVRVDVSFQLLPESK